MKNFKWLILSIVVLGLLIPGYAQMNQKSNMKRANLDINQTVLIKGKIIKVEKFTRSGVNYRGMHLIVQNKKGKSSIHLGPEFYLLNQKFELKKGQLVEINSFKGLYQGKTAYFARDLKAQGKVIVLRNSNGYPNWSRRLGRSGKGQGRGKQRTGRGNYRRGSRNSGSNRGYNRIN